MSAEPTYHFGFDPGDVAHDGARLSRSAFVLLRSDPDGKVYLLAEGVGTDHDRIRGQFTDHQARVMARAAELEDLSRRTR